jgi:dienelactone hydrolase
MKRNLSILAILVLLVSCNRGNRNSANSDQNDSTMTSKTSIVTKEITYQLDTLVMKGYIAYDSSVHQKRPGILVVHEWWGLNDYARMRTRMLAELGYTAMAVDMYGNNRMGETPELAGKYAGEVMSNPAVAIARFSLAYNHLKEQESVDSAKIGAIGYCFGGGVVLLMARSGMNLSGVVSFHGSIGTKTPVQKGNIKGSVLVCNGGADKFITPEQIESFKKEMENAGVDYKFISYPGAVHAFTNPDADLNAKKFNLSNIGYNEAADKQSWEEMKSFFTRIF